MIDLGSCRVYCLELSRALIASLGVGWYHIGTVYANSVSVRVYLTRVGRERVGNIYVMYGVVVQQNRSVSKGLDEGKGQMEQG